MKENLKPCVYKLWEHVKVRPRTFCRTVRRVAGTGEVKYLKVRSRSESKSKKGVKSVRADPKPGDLSMSRLKFP